MLPSWRPGRTRDAVLAFLDAAPSIPPRDRLACFDNDGTLWCERPHYVQFDFLVNALVTRVAVEPELKERPEFAALLSGDAAAVQKIGLVRVAMALTGLFEGMRAEVFAAHVREFLAGAVHPTLGRPLRTAIYLPMLELIEELRRLDFTVAVVTGGGTEFVRAISHDLYGVPPQNVVGTLVEYDYVNPGGAPDLTRSTRLLGAANEGPAKVVHIQTQLGRRPVLAAGNTDGDREMLEWAQSAEGPSLALLVDHDDADREFRYEGKGETTVETEPIAEIGHREGWTVISVAQDWETVFAAGDG